MYTDVQLFHSAVAVYCGFILEAAAHVCMFWCLSFLQRGWQLGKDNFLHFKVEPKHSVDEVIPAKKLAKQTIEYARELEMIV